MLANNTLRLYFALCMGVISNVYGETGTHCKPDEKVFFSCPIGKKTVSYCESKANGADNYLEYRYGKPYQIELSYKAGANNSANKFNRAEFVGASNGGTDIWFKNNGIFYVLSAPIRGGPYLELFRDGKSIARLPCNDAWGKVDGDPESSSSMINIKTQNDFFVEVLGEERSEK